MKAPFTFWIIAIVTFSSCKKNNVQTNAGGNEVVKGSISLYVAAMHHSWAVGGISVFLKKDATTFPGADTSKYTWKALADAGGNVKFPNLFPGNYFVYATGIDHAIGMPVVGYNIQAIELNSSTITNNEYYYTLYVSE